MKKPKVSKVKKSIKKSKNKIKKPVKKLGGKLKERKTKTSLFEAEL